MGIFTVHPKNQAPVTCSMMEDESVNYQVWPSSIDFNYGERMKVAYAETNAGGAVRASKSGLVSVKFSVYVFGSSQANALANLGTLQRAFTNGDGYIQYRPIGLDSAMSTYYHFLKSSPPSLPRGDVNLIDAYQDSRFGQFKRDSAAYVVLAEFEVMTKAWGTSDPDAPVTAVEATDIINQDDGESNINYITLEASSIKGDGLIPIVKISGDVSAATGPHYTTRLFLHMKRVEIGESSNRDWMTADIDYNDSLSDATEAGEYLGRLSPITGAAAASGATHDINFFTRSSNMDDEVYSNDSWIRITNTTPQVIYQFNEINVPPWAVPDWVTDDSSPTLAGYNSFLRIGVDERLIDGSGSVSFSFLWVPKVDGANWFGMADYTEQTYYSPCGLVSDPGGALEYTVVWFDAISGTVYQTDNNGILMYDWDLAGKTLYGFVMQNGYDWKVRVAGMEVTPPELDVPPEPDEEYGDDIPYELTVMGLWVTIFPFNEA